MLQTRSNDQFHTPVFAPHCHVYFYLHRPQTSTRHPVVIPLSPNIRIVDALRDRTVLEFPSIYALPDSPDALRADTEKHGLLLEESLCTSTDDKESGSGLTMEEQEYVGQDNLDEQDSKSGHGSGDKSMNIESVDEKKILEVLKQDLYENATAEEAAQ